MPLPRAVARLNKRYTNRFIEPVVARLPGFAVVEHVGRHSGSTYRTPIYVFGDEHFLVALTYGPSADWVQNVVTNGGVIEQYGVHHLIRSSTLVDRSMAWPHLPGVVRFVLRILRVTDFLRIVVR